VRNVLIAAAGALLTAFAADSSAQVYRWVDANGAPADASARAAAASQPEVIMYATDWCPYCRQAREHFARQGIAYREVDIEKSAAGRAEYDRLGGRGVPLILVGSRRMQGFRVESFDRLLRSAGR
jgi:glutaredoxin